MLGTAAASDSMRAWGLLLVGIMLAPLASASSARGDFSTTGDLSFSARATLGFSAQALYTDSHDPANLSAPLLRVTSYEQQDAAFSVGPLPPTSAQVGPLKQRSFTVHDASVTLTSLRGGWTGLYPDAAGRMTMTPSGSANLHPNTLTMIPNGRAGTDAPDQPFYYARVTGPHFDIDGAGSVLFDGAGALKVLGARVRIVAAENTTEFDTGAEPTGPAQETLRWVYLSWDVGRFALDASPALQLAARDSASFTSSSLAFVPTGGEMDTPGARYVAQPGEVATVAGALAGTVTTPDGRAAALHVEGDVRATSLLARPAPVAGPALAGLPAWIGLAVAGAVVASGGAVAVLGRRRARVHPRPRRVRRAAQHAALAQDAREEGSLAEALKHIRRALALVSSGAYHFEEGLLLKALGSPAEARDCFALASRGLVDGEAEMKAADCALQLGEVDDAARWVVLALGKSQLDPRVLAWIATEPRFAPLRAWPAVAEPLRAALARQATLGWPRDFDY